jgi:hypothetical protein
MADDDIVCEPWTADDREKGLRVASHGDPSETEFFACRENALNAARRTEADLLAMHSAFLGNSLGTVLARSSEQVDLSDACGHVIGALVDGRAQTVRMTFSAIAGDAATYCPYLRLFSTGGTLARMAANRGVYDLALCSREVLRSPKGVVITHDSQCMAGCMALANTALVPPFMPLGRNEDGVFGAMLGAIDPLAVFAHLPMGVIHDSARPAIYEGRLMKSASEMRLSETMIAIIRSGMNVITADPAARLGQLGNVLDDISRLDLQDFSIHLRHSVLGTRARQLSRIEAMLDQTSQYPAHWRSDLEAYRCTLIQSLARPDFFVPVEFQHCDSVRLGYVCTQQFVRQFAELISTWPALWAEARHAHDSEWNEGAQRQ